MSTFTHIWGRRARWIAGVNHRFGEAMRHCRSFHFVDVRVDETDDSEVWLVQTCPWWKCLRALLPAAQMCSPRSWVRLGGSAHSGGETCACRRSMIETDVKTKVVYKEWLGLLSLSLSAFACLNWEMASLLYPKWSSTPRSWHTPSTLFAMKLLVLFQLISIHSP